MQSPLRFILTGSASLLLANAALAAGTSFDCSKVESGSIEAMVCQSDELAALDRQLAGVYGAAAKKASNEHPPVLKTGQRGWIKGRNDCWKATDIPACVKDSYQLRIAELQARYQLVGYIGPVLYQCNANPVDGVVVTFFKTAPATLIAERGDSVALMYQVRSGSGAKYEGQNNLFWEHQGQATIRWGYGAAEMNCRKSP
jgi:uncharacterized protein